MGWDFIRNYNGARMASYSPFEPPAAQSDDQPLERVNRDYEPGRAWTRAIEPATPRAWQAKNWIFSPIRFIDGKDVGDTVAWVRDQAGHPAPFRLSTIGSTALRLVNGELRREYALVENVVTAVLNGFPTGEVESFARALQQENMRLLLANPPDNQLSYDFETMRKAAQNRSNDEMGTLEEAALAHGANLPTLVDGRLGPRQGGFSIQDSPVFGVIKTHNKTYLHPQGIQLMQDLGVGQRTPVFSLPNEHLPVASWYLRLAGNGRSMPSWGIVRVEMSLNWFENNGKDFSIVDQLSRTLYEYRCREQSYSRAPISLHPIVRAEESLGSLFPAGTALLHRFYRHAGL
jgi:hypothetical protein